jgi:hypothetical protein
MVRSGAPPGRRNPRDVGQRLRSAGRLETAHVVVHHGLEVLAPELPVPYCGEPQPALHMQGGHDGLLLGGRQAPRIPRGAGGQQLGWPDQAAVVVDVIPIVVGHS